MTSWLRVIRKFDIIRIGLITLLITVSTGHVGRLFADREASGQGIIGYALALGIDGVLAIALYEVTKTKGQHRNAALAVFLLACGVSGGFNVSYYRIYHPVDPMWTSILLGLTAPVLAASIAVLKSFGDVEREEASIEEREAERQSQSELEKFKIQQAEETKRLVEIEKTKRAEERTKQQRIKAKAETRKRARCEICGEEVSEAMLEDGKCLDCQRSLEGKSHALPLELSLEVLDRDEWMCYYCGENLREVPAGERHIDHFIPKSKGGTNSIENLVTSCSHCNLSKNDRMPNEREQQRFSLYLRAKAAGPDKRTQILELASTNGDRRPLKQKEIAEILHTSPGWVSTIVKEAERSQNEEN